MPNGVVRFIHTSDWQLGMTRAFLPEEAAARFAQARVDAIKRLGELAQEHAAAFIVVAGDVFESNQLSRQVVLRTLDALQCLPVPVYLLPGNHDPLDASSIFNMAELAALPSVIVLRDQTPVSVPGLPDVEVVGAPWKSKRPTHDLVAELCGSLDTLAEGRLRVAVAHGQLDCLSPDSERPETISLATAEAALADRRIHYLALGDRHSVTAPGSSQRIWYSGAPVATDFTEDDPNKALLVELDEASCRVSPLQLGDWHFITAERDINGADDVAALSAWLEELADKERCIIKIGLRGSISIACAAQLDELFERNAQRFAALWRWKRKTQLSVMPDQLDEDALGLSGYARAAWDELQSAAGDDSEAADALRLLYRMSVQSERASAGDSR